MSEMLEKDKPEQCKMCLFSAFDAAMICRPHRLNFTIQNIAMSFPIIGKHLKPYNCPDFFLDKDNKLHNLESELNNVSTDP